MVDCNSNVRTKCEFKMNECGEDNASNVATEFCFVVSENDEF